MIIRGGENIYPREIEELLFEHPAVVEVAVVGIPDERWGEQVGAFVRMSDGRQCTSAELHDYMREHLAPQKTPRVWIRVEEFPMTQSGKIQKFKLAKLFSEGLLKADF
jgi:fatty-acyl-CoA synthase